MMAENCLRSKSCYTSAPKAEKACSPGKRARSLGWIRTLACGSKTPTVSYDLPLDFKEWLYRNYRPSYAETVYLYCKRYGYMLTENKLTALHSLSSNVKRHTMNALSALSKFMGIYQEYRSALQQLGIKRSRDNAVDIFKRIYNHNENNNMLDWLYTVKKASLKPEYTFAINYMALTGLRTSEAIESLNIIAKEGLSTYYNSDYRTLEHFRYPAIFIRGTKNCYVSIVPPLL